MMRAAFRAVIAPTLIAVRLEGVVVLLFVDRCGAPACSTAPAGGPPFARDGLPETVYLAATPASTLSWVPLT
jgi:hypothetical protein